MDKRGLLLWYDCLAKVRMECDECPDRTKCTSADKDIRRLIESSGESPLDIPRAIVDKQAEDASLWFVAQTASEAYLQKALRQLHAAIEGREPEQIISSIIKSSGERTVRRDFPKIICLCGSTRFTSEMLIKQWELTKQRYIVLSWCALPDSYFAGEDKAHIGDQEGIKNIVDEVHKRKIDLADEVFILNIDGYVGESTRSEIEYAKAKGKKLSYEVKP